MRSFRILSIIASIVVAATANHVKAQGPATLDDALRYFQSPKSTDRAFALSVMGLMGPEARPATREICEGFLDPSPAVRRAAALAIPLVNPAIADTIITIQQSDSYRRRLQAILQLAKLGDDAASAVPIVLAFMEQARPEDQAAVVNALATVGVRDPDLAKRFATWALGHRNPAVRQAALAALPRLPDAQDTIPLFLNNIGPDRDNATRLIAIAALTALGSGNRDVLQALENLSRTTASPQIKRAADAALSRLQQSKPKRLF